MKLVVEEEDGSVTTYHTLDGIKYALEGKTWKGVMEAILND